MRKKKTFLISPVKTATERKLRILARIVKHLEDAGWDVHWPYRDTEQIDPTGGLRICQDNMDAIGEADVVHVVWDGISKGSLFDIGMAFSMGKRIIPLVLPALTEGKSMQNMVWRYYQDKEGETRELEKWMMEILDDSEIGDDVTIWDSTLLDGLDEECECWEEEDEEFDRYCCEWMRMDANDSNLLSEEYYRSLSMDEDGNYYQDSNFYIRGNPYPIHHCPGCGRRLDNE